MPVEFLDRLPIPNLRAYTAISFAVLSCSVYYAAQIIKDPAWRNNHTYVDTENEATIGIETDPRSFTMHLKELIECMLDEVICIWTLINMAYCVLILLGKTIQKLVFGELRASERQHLKDKFWNFAFYKFIFVFGVLNLQFLDEVVLWWAWFTALGFLSLLSQLCGDRFNHLATSPTTPGSTHTKLLGLLATILALSSIMLLLCTAAAFSFVSFSTFVFTAAECILLGMRTIHVMMRYIIHLYDTQGAGTSSQRSLDKRGPLIYYTDLAMELIVLAVDFLHHIHMLVWSNILLSMASIVIFVQLKYLLNKIQRKITKHRNYLTVLNHMEQNYPMVTEEELAGNSDDCAMCWDKMDTARKLPCCHLFHNSCLQSWLVKDTSCPTCRLALSMQPSHRESTQELPTEPQTPVRRHFHFDGSRYWLPSFFVEVSPSGLRGNISTLENNTARMETMIRQVQQLFPHFPRNRIVGDLRMTRSVEWTVENILDGVLISPSHLIEEPQSESVLQIHTSATETNDSSTTLSTSLPSDPKVHIPPLADSGEQPSSLGGPFSESSSEREQSLQRRKELMRLTAKRRYFEKHRKKQGADELVSSATS